MKKDKMMQELNYLLALQKVSCEKYEEIKKITTDIQLQDFLEVTTRHLHELINELEHAISNKHKMEINDFLKNEIQVDLLELRMSLVHSNVREVAKKIAAIEKKIIEKYKEDEQKNFPISIDYLLKTHIMTLQEIFLQANVLARMGIF